MMSKRIKIELGDLVQLSSNTWHKKVGLVTGTPKNWWVIKDHFDVANCIAHKKDITIIKKNVVPKKLRIYLSGE